MSIRWFSWTMGQFSSILDHYRLAVLNLEFRQLALHKVKPSLFLSLLKSHSPLQGAKGRLSEAQVVKYSWLVPILAEGRVFFSMQSMH
jgi:hypothetical protein